MKTIVCLCALFALSAARPQAAKVTAVAAPAAAGAAAPAATAGVLPPSGAQPAAPLNNLRLMNNPQFYGRGISAQALPVHPIVIREVEKVLAQQPGLLARVNLNGEIEFTNSFGEEVEVTNFDGSNPLEAHERFQDNEFVNREVERRLALARQQIFSEVALNPQFHSRFLIQ